MMHFIISGSIRKEIRNIMSFTELTKLHWLLSNGHFSVISERALVFRNRHQSLIVEYHWTSIEDVHLYSFEEDFNGTNINN